MCNATKKDTKEQETNQNMTVICSKRHIMQNMYKNIICIKKILYRLPNGKSLRA